MSAANQDLSSAFQLYIWWPASGYLSCVRCWVHGEVRPHHQATGEETKVAPKFLRRGVGESRGKAPNPVCGHLEGFLEKVSGEQS